uniref:Putative replication protein A n=1 Tax=Campylobacter lari TaxID=201 RepID=Q53U46_CAMLA|nr:putative replication protein A [Campylobacter lari]
MKKHSKRLKVVLYLNFKL